MFTTAKPLLALTAEDLMSREVVTVPRRMSLRDAAGLLRRARISGAPVLDEPGRCVGVLSATDFLRWAEDGCPGAADGPALACPYQVKGRRLTGEETVICTLAEGGCPLQEVRPLTGGRHAVRRSRMAGSGLLTRMPIRQPNDLKQTPPVQPRRLIFSIQDEGCS